MRFRMLVAGVVCLAAATAAAGFTAASATAATPQDAPPAPAVAQIGNNGSSNLCLSVPGASKQYHCGRDTDNIDYLDQSWAVIPGEGGYVLLTWGTNLCLSVPGGLRTERAGSIVNQYYCGTFGDQRWDAVPFPF